MIKKDTVTAGSLSGNCPPSGHCPPPGYYPASGLPVRAAIELIGISAGYGRKQIIRDMGISFKKGTVTSIIGRNGSGKTTLLKIIAGLLKPACGEIKIEGRDIMSYKGKELARKVSFLRQIQNMPAVSVYDLVMYGRYPYLPFTGNPGTKDIEIVEKALEAAGATEFRGSNISELSGGEARKVWIAMVLAQDTEIILMDEPSVFLDINHQLELLSLSAKLKIAGRTIIMVLHDISSALACSDMVCLLDSGRDVIYDTPEAVYASGLIESTFNVKCSRVSTASGTSGYLFGLK